MKKYSSITKGSSRRTSPIKKRIGLVVIIGSALVSLLWLAPVVFGFVAALVLTPIQTTHSWLQDSSNSLPQYFRDRTELIDQYNTLKEQLLTEEGQSHSVQLLSRENEELRSLLGDNEAERVVAGVIGRPGALPYDVLVIDQGSQDGIVKHAPVFIGDNRVIGEVVKVFTNTAVVRLVTTAGYESSVYIVGPDIYTNAVGIGGGQLRVGVPQGIVLEVGNQVILPTVDKGWFGEIVHLESLPTRPEQYGYVSTDIPLRSLHYVAVGKTALSPISFEEAQAHVANSTERLFTVPVPEGVLVVPREATSTATSSAAETASTSDETDI